MKARTSRGAVGSGHVARKRFGQNFLVDPGVIAAIVTAIDPRPGDTVVEIGPGLGALTEPLLARLAHSQPLHVVELDRDLCARLRARHDAAHLTVHEGDALAFDFAQLGPRQKLVGNLPYNISTPLLFHLASFADCILDMHFMLQKEVVERMVAAPGEADYGRLSVMLQYRFHLEWLLDVPRGSFDPPPKVDSAVVRLSPKPPGMLTAKSETALARVVQAAFSQRRKMLRNTLKELFAESTFVELGIAPTARAETLTVEQYIALANRLAAG